MNGFAVPANRGRNMDNKYVAVDLDGVIAEYDGWKGEFHIGPPKDGTKEWLKHLKLLGFDIIIHTCRRNKETIKEYLENNRLPYDHINENPEQPETAGDDKIFAHYYIDDRNPHFKGLGPAVKKIEDEELEEAE